MQEPRRFVFIERWESQDALAAHAKSAHIQAYKKAAADWIEHAEIRVMSKIARIRARASAARGHAGQVGRP
ncbi:quinol monooxygenase YgiN [Paraburkholderia sp. MM5477-R1]